MINPGGNVRTTFSKSAQTRLNNDQIRATKSSMPHNLAAQESLRLQTSKASAGGPPVGSSLQGNPVMNSNLGQPGGPQTVLPQRGGPPVLPPAMHEGFDPALLQENLLDEVVGAVRTEQFLNSAGVKDAATSVRLKNVLNASNPNKAHESRDLITQVINRLGH